MYEESQARIAQDKRNQGLYLVSLAGYAGNAQIAAAALNRFLRVSIPCPEALPGLPYMRWCPQTLIDLAHLENYYNQWTMEEALERKHGFPNAFYINGVDVDGTIRTGTQQPWGTVVSDDGEHQTTKYAFVATVLAWNLHLGCSRGTGATVPTPHGCAAMKATLTAIRDAYPVRRWSDPQYGRYVTWQNASRDDRHGAGA